MKMTKPLEILLVDDREENRAAAQAYFATRNDVHVTYGTTFKEGLDLLQKKVYAFGIFDLELPKTTGSEPEKLGDLLAQAASRQRLDWVIITAGNAHRGCSDPAQVKYSWGQPDYGNDEGSKYIDYSKMGVSGEWKGFAELVGISKSDPRAWEEVFQRFMEVFPEVQGGLAARERYFNRTGRMLRYD
jgi:hypothetical protein